MSKSGFAPGADLSCAEDPYWAKATAAAKHKTNKSQNARRMVPPCLELGPLFPRWDCLDSMLCRDGAQGRAPGQLGERQPTNRRARCLLSASQGSEFIEREEVANSVRDILGEVCARRRGGRHFPADDPAEQLLPFLRGDGPAGVLGPLALLAGIPVAFIPLREAAFLFRNPPRVCEHARPCNLRERRRLALVIGIDAKACRDHIRGDSDIELAALPALASWPGKHQVHLGAIRGLIPGKSNVAVDAREIRAGAAADVEACVQFVHGGRKPLEQSAERLDDMILIAAAVLVHPLFAIIASEFAKESKCLRAKEGLLRRHGKLHGNMMNHDAKRCQKNVMGVKKTAPGLAGGSWILPAEVGLFSRQRRSRPRRFPSFRRRCRWNGRSRWCWQPSRPELRLREPLS